MDGNVKIFLIGEEQDFMLLKINVEKNAMIMQKVILYLWKKVVIINIFFFHGQLEEMEMVDVNAVVMFIE
jgi:hypothetical protein